MNRREIFNNNLIPKILNQIVLFRLQKGLEIVFRANQLHFDEDRALIFHGRKDPLWNRMPFFIKKEICFEKCIKNFNIKFL